MSLILRTDNFDGNFDGAYGSARLWCEATVAIVAGDWIAISPTDTSNPGAVIGETYIAADATSPTDPANYDVVGVAPEALASGTGWVVVQTKGRRTSVNVDAAVDAGDILCVGTTKGRAIEMIFDGTGNENRRAIGRAVTVAVTNGSHLVTFSGNLGANFVADNEGATFIDDGGRAFTINRFSSATE